MLAPHPSAGAGVLSPNVSSSKIQHPGVISSSPPVWVPVPGSASSLLLAARLWDQPQPSQLRVGSRGSAARLQAHKAAPGPVLWKPAPAGRANVWLPPEPGWRRHEPRRASHGLGGASAAGCFGRMLPLAHVTRGTGVLQTSRSRRGCVESKF